MVTRPMQIGVIGAGIVGAACALRLALDGHKVTILDPAEPGSGCSHGNAGQIGTAGIVPFVNPRTAAKAWGWMRDPNHPLRVSYGAMARNIPWILRFRKAATDPRSEAATVALHGLVTNIYDDLAPLVAASDSQGLILRNGSLQVFENEDTYRGMEPDYALRERYGIAIHRLSRADLLDLEPSLGPRARHGVLFEDAALVRDPGGLAKSFVRAVVDRGGALDARHVRRLVPGDSGVTAVTDSGPRSFDKVVLAAGIHARDFFRPLGVRVPIWAERGYHLQLSDVDHGLTRSVLFYDHRVVYTPVAAGLRLTTGAEFTEPDAAPDHAFYRRIIESARGLLRQDPDLDRAKAWVGSRPSPPDFLPIIGPAPKLPNVILAAGHGHSGLTFAAPTARLVSDIVADRAAPASLAPFSPGRAP